MQFLDLTLASLAENLALDEALLLDAEAGGGGEVLRLWEWPRPAVVLGAACRLAEDVDQAACVLDGVPMLRRASGGGTVLLGRGCLLYSLVLAYDTAPALTEIRPSYRYVLERLRDALTDPAHPVELEGVSDLTVAGRKFSGNAQQRKRSFLLHHGTVLYDFDLGLVGRSLRQPARQPAYRGRREHAAFLINLPLGPEEIRQRVRAAWRAAEARVRWPEDVVRRLAADKFSNPDWTQRR